MFWTDEINPFSLTAVAVPAENPADVFDIFSLARRVTLLRLKSGAELLLLSDGRFRIQLEVHGASLLGGGTSLRYELEGFRSIEPKLLTLRRFLALRRLGHFPAGLFTAERRVARGFQALLVYDAVRQDKPQREIAEGLFGRALVRDEWAGRSDFLRLRVQRLRRLGERLVNGGYRALFLPDNS